MFAEPENLDETIAGRHVICACEPGVTGKNGDVAIKNPGHESLVLSSYNF